MQFRVLLFCAFVVFKAYGQSTRDNDFTRDTIRSESVFKSDYEYTFSYNADMEMKMPINREDQSTGINFKTQVKLNFLPKGSGYNKVRMTLTNPLFSTSTRGSTNTFGIPTHKSLQLNDEVMKDLQNEIYFHYKDGVVLRIFHRKNEPVWIVNMKRGIINLLSVDVFGRTGYEEEIPFKKLEKTILGVCNCTYTVMESDGMFVNVTKTIDGGECRNDRETVDSILTTEHRDDTKQTGSSRIQKQSTIDYELVRSRSNTVKILSASATGTTMLYMLNDDKQPITGVTNQTLRLVEEKQVAKQYFEFPAWKAQDLMFYLPNQKIQATQLSYEESQQFAELIHNILAELAKSYNDLTKPLSKEFAFKILEVVNMIRPLKYRQLDVQWRTCMQDSNVRELFMRVFSMIQTVDSLRLMDNKIRYTASQLTPKLLEDYFEMLVTHNHVERAMIPIIKDLCSHEVIKKNGDVQMKCFMAAVVMRRKFCGRKICLWLQQPSELRRALEIRRFVTLKEEKQIQYLQIADSAEDRQFIDTLVYIVRNDKISIRVRKHAILALRPLVRIARTRVTHPLNKLLIYAKYPQEIRQTIYMVLLDSPTPSIIHGCAQHMVTESSVSIRRYVYEALLSMATETHSSLADESKTTARIAVEFLRHRELVPTNLRWFSQHLSSVNTPLPGSDLKLLWKAQLHQTNDSLIPKSVFGQLDVSLFGKQFNVFDMHMETEGVQEFLAQLTGSVPKAENPNLSTEPSYTPKDMTLFGNVKLFGRHWMTGSRTIRHEDVKERDSSVLGKFYTWKQLAQKLNNGYKYESRKVFMPLEVVVRVPTCVGLPLVYSFSTMFVDKMENFVQTRSPTLLDIPYFFFNTVDLKAEFIHKQRSVLLLRGSVYYESPVIHAGFHHNKTMNISIDLQASIKTNIQTMKSSTTLQMPKLPELVTVESESETFVKYFDQDSKHHLKFVHRTFPVSFDHNLNRYKPVTTNRPFDSPISKSEDIHSTFNLRLTAPGGTAEDAKYLSTRYQDVVTGDSPKEWKIIPADNKIHHLNDTIVTLFAPGTGYIFVDPSTKQLRISNTRRTYFLVESSPGGTLTFKTLVATQLFSKPTDSEEQLANVASVLGEMQKNELRDTEEMRRAYRMINEDYISNAVNVMYITFNQLDQTFVMSENLQQTCSFLPQLQQHSSHFYTQKVDQNKKCYFSDWLPVCIHGIWSRHVSSPLTGARTFFEPSLVRVRTTSQVEKIQMKIEPSGELENKKFSLTISPVGSSQPKNFQVSWSHDTKSRKFSMDVFPDTTTSSDRFMCFRAEYPQNTVRAMLSFDTSCQTNVIEIYNINHQTPSLYSMDFKWLVKLGDSSIPKSTKRILSTFYQSPIVGSFINKKAISKLMEDNSVVGDSYAVRGDANVYLTSPTTLRIKFNNTRSMYERTIRLPTSMERIPYGYTDYTFVQQAGNAFRSTCTHRANFFKTFDQVEYKYQIPDSECEQVLVKTCSRDVPRMEVLVKEVRNGMKHIRATFGSSEVTISPRRYDTIPEVSINRQLQPISTSNAKSNEYTLPNKMTLKFHWIEETKTLFLINEDLGIELLVVASRTIHIRLSTMLFGKVCGMCGDMNSEQALEMRTPEMVEVDDPIIFGLSWMRTSESCKSGECPLERKKSQVTFKGERCTSQIELPQCFAKCRTIKRVTLQNVPATCGTGSYQKTVGVSISTPLKCQCSC